MVSLNAGPYHSTYTDTNGFFYLKATRNFHWGYVPPEGDWPDRKDNIMKISHPNYATIWGTWGTNTGDIFLKPKP